jgi:hypothetical protein
MPVFSGNFPVGALRSCHIVKKILEIIGELNKLFLNAITLLVL